jgi:SET domain-containing protein
MQPCSISRKNGLYMKYTKSKGRGVFCREHIASGEIIEVAPVFIFNEKDMEHVHKTSIRDYYFKANKFSRSVYLWLNIGDSSKVACLSMGITSFCNHLIDPNAICEFAEESMVPFFILKAARDIPPDTEICINYGVAWFAAHKGK